MKVVIFSNIPAPYFVEYLNELNNYVEVDAYFERKKASDRDSSWNCVKNSFKLSYLTGLKYGKENSFSLEIIRVIEKNKNNCLIFANPMTLSGILGILYCNLKKIRYLIQSEGGLPKKGVGFKESLKKYIITNARMCLSGMTGENDYFISYGASKNRVKWYPFASLHKNDLISYVPSKKEKNMLKNELKIPYDKVVLYVGQVIERKGIDILIEACSNFKDNIGIYIVGGNETPELQSLKIECNIKNINYIPFVNLEVLKKYYMLSDVFVLPTREDTWGLVVNEAMSYGLPVITTNKCVAGLELIEDGVNGYLIDSENSQALKKKILKLLDDDNLAYEIGNKNLDKIKDFTYENMAKIIAKNILGLLSED